MRIVQRRLVEVSQVGNLKLGDIFITVSKSVEGKVPLRWCNQRAYKGEPFTHESYMLIGLTKSIKHYSLITSSLGKKLPVAAAGLSDGLVYSFDYDEEVIALDVHFLGPEMLDNYLNDTRHELGMVYPKKISFLDYGNYFTVRSEPDWTIADTNTTPVYDWKKRCVGFVEREQWVDAGVVNRVYRFIGHLKRAGNQLWLIVEGDQGHDNNGNPQGLRRKIPLMGYPVKNVA